MSATEVFNLYRSLYSFKQVTTIFNKETVKLTEIAPCSNDLKRDLSDSEPGQIEYCKKSKQLLVKCADDSLVELRQLMFGKKKAMSASDFNNGFLKKLSKSDCRFQTE